jgi:membrane-bound PQQ-dependent dehydrogenase (glucose/quinate/shikimate family)
MSGSLPADTRTSPLAARLYAALLLLAGLPQVVGGARLLALGGSHYYLLAGAATMAAGLLLWRRSGWGAILYGALLLYTALWSTADGSFDFWVQATRLAFPFALGLGFLLPAVRRGLDRGPAPRRAGVAAAGLGLLLVAVTAAAALNGGRYNLDPKQPLPGPAAAGDATPDGDWRAYGNDAAGTRFSPLSQITPANVGGLKLAWSYRTGDFPPASGYPRRLEVTPIKVGDTLYLCTPRSTIVALDPETGRERWTFDPKVDLGKVDSAASCRGVAYYRLASAQPGEACGERVFTAAVDGRLIAVDARTGSPCTGFGEGGQVDLTRGLGELTPGYYTLTSAPVVVRGRVIVGGRISDGQFVGEPGGVIRAFDAATGAFAWAFDPGNPTVHDAPPEGGHYTRGTPNSWAPMSADEQLGMVYVPTGNATPDYFGAHRTALDETYASAVVALDAETGEARWVFQTTHHDLWDYDVASQPSLVDLSIGGQTVPALLQPTKRGQLFLLDRRSGKPLADVEERPAPGGAVPGERLAPTQPYSVGMPALDGLPMGESDMWGLTPYDALWCRLVFKRARWQGAFTPPGVAPYLEMPGGLGGVNWGGATIDPERGLAFVAWTRTPLLNRLIPREEADRMGLRPIGPGQSVGGTVPQIGTPYAAAAAPFWSPLGIPCIAPPYGIVSAIDLGSRRLVWSRRLGTAEHSRVAGVKSRLPLLMGLPVAGGSLVTRSGLLLIGAVGDNALRAYDIATGRQLWKAALPAGANATPMTYLSEQSGRQFVVIAAGGHPMIQADPGDSILAFALDRRP